MTRIDPILLQVPKPVFDDKSSKIVKTVTMTDTHSVRITLPFDCEEGACDTQGAVGYNVKGFSSPPPKELKSLNNAVLR